jgi:hypothetical protein
MVFEKQAGVPAEGPRVLIVGGDARGLFGMVQRLEQWGCQCFLVDTEESASRLFSQESFDLVLAIGRQCCIGATLATVLRGTSASLFRAVPVEDGCWWIPLLREGRECNGGAALRPAEFGGLVQEIVCQSKRRAKGPLGMRFLSPAQPEPAGNPSLRLAAGDERGDGITSPITFWK